VANPAGLMNSAAQLLRHLGFPAAGERLSAAVREAMLGRPTADVAEVVGGTSAATSPASTTEYSEAVFALLAGPGVGY
jgi:3-isopropylmalate dehydrogenase